MIKELTADNARVITENQGKVMRVSEKFDTYYFTMHFSEDGVEKIVNMNGAEIDFVDYTVNSIYKNIIEFCGTLCEKLSGVITGKHVIGFNYFPSEKPRYINYPEHSGKFFFQELWKIEDGKKVLKNHNETCLMLQETGLDNIECIFNIDIQITPELISRTNSYITDGSSALMYMHELLKSVPKERRPKPQQLMKAEAYILRVDNEVRKVEITHKETLGNAIQKKMSRDMVLKDFADWFVSTHQTIDHGHTYIGIVSDLFLRYINDTDIFNKYSITKEDLTPPTMGTVGDISYDFIDNKAVETIIRNDENRLALFKVLLASLRKPLSKKKGDLITGKTLEEFNSIVNTIKAMA